MYKPQGYTDVSPYLIVEDAQATLDFLARVFAAEALRVHRDESGIIRHGEAQVGDSVVMVGQADGGTDAHIHVYVADPDDAFNRAIAAGAKIIQPLDLQPDGDRRGGVRDANGTNWWIASQRGE